MKRTWKDITGFDGKYQIAHDGAIRTGSGKAKKTIKDVRGREMVVLNDVAFYVSDLVHKEFGGDHLDKSLRDEEALCKADATIKMLKKRLGIAEAKNFRLNDDMEKLKAQLAKVSAPKRPRLIIKNVDSGEEFSGYAACAKACGFNYDKFYNAFYTSGQETITFEGQTFNLVHSPIV